MNKREAAGQNSPREEKTEIYAKISREAIRAYLENMIASGCVAATVKLYAAHLEAFYNFLPPGKRVFKKTVQAWRDELLARGYAPSTVNIYISATDGLLDNMGYRDLQLVDRLSTAHEAQPKLSREEYLRMLQAAKDLGRERSYLMVKIFALTGIRVGELIQMTAEDVKAGQLLTGFRGANRYIQIPDCLRQELLDYIHRQRIDRGPVFITSAGRCIHRTQVTTEIQNLCRNAQVDKSKGTPRCLRRLYQDTRENMEASVRLLVKQQQDLMLESEQKRIAWSR